MSVAHSVSSRPLPMEVQQISLDRIREFKSNSRRVFDEAKLRELADNIKVHGVLQPILVRPLPEGPEGTYELVAGARRFRASTLAGQQAIPATVREFSEAGCRENVSHEYCDRRKSGPPNPCPGKRSSRSISDVSVAGDPSGVLARSPAIDEKTREGGHAVSSTD